MENSIGYRIEEKYTRYLNCETDTLELTIEEAIFILETDESLHYVEDLLQEAYKVILSEYKRVLKENEILKEEKEQAWGEWNNLEQGSYETEQKLKQQIKKLQKENEELNYKLHSKKIALEIYNRYIPKSKVEDKIEKLNSESYAEKFEDMMNTKNYTITELVQYVLQELLDGSDTDVGSIGSEN